MASDQLVLLDRTTPWGSTAGRNVASCARRSLHPHCGDAVAISSRCGSLWLNWATAQKPGRLC